MKKFIVLLLFAFSFQAQAQQKFSPSDEDFHYSSYFKIKYDPRFEKIDLLNFETINETFPLPAIPYNRDSQFGGWLVDSTDGNCLNTRAKVLVRDSVTTPTFSASGCVVYSGEWNDPYTAKLYTKARDIQIDHLVALKNAYMTGAHEWDFKKRCLYANYLGNNFNLLSVDGPENLKKSDQSPAGYTPPNKAYICQFIKQWLNVKLIWNLRVTPKEGDAIHKIASDYDCNPELFMVSSRELTEQHRYIQDHANICATPNVMLQAF